MKRLILIRHAERPAIPADAVGNEVLLTPQGEADAQAFIRQLACPVVSMKSSPISRCVQTTRLMADVIGYPAERIALSRDLGDPGFIISDGAKAWDHWQAKGHTAVNEHLLSGAERWHGFADLELATQAFANTIMTELQESEPGLHVWVTHDTILATFASRVLPQPLPIQQWPHFLGYLDIRLVGEGLTFSYHGEG
ncbi:MAG: histidine phosphatase family protein [Oceanospirillaceae bacterium]|nr:histidine phosphatase family protein [Oceanospirillaceae bacterium]